MARIPGPKCANGGSKASDLGDNPHTYMPTSRVEVSCTQLGSSSQMDVEVGASPKPHPPLSPAVPAVAAAVVLYAACSSTLLLINAVAVRQVGDASFVLCCQFLTSSATCRAIKCARPETDIELITWTKGRPFFLASLVFFLCLLSNTEALRSVNPETVIVARSCSPVAVALLEHLTLGRQLPSLRGIMSLLCIAGGAFVYVLADKGFHIDGYMWLAIYYVFIVVEMIFVKYVVDSISMSTWTRVYYNNTLSLPLVFISSMLLGSGKFMEVDWNVNVVLTVLLSCVVGVAISYAGFNLRKLVSATSFTVVGVVCKLITILINDIMWENHSNAMGHVGLLICIGSGFLYERTKHQSK